MASYFQDYLDFARKNSTVNLQMSLIFEMARTAITRGYTFIGFGINGIDNPSTSHELVHGDFPPDRVPQQFRLAQFNDDELAKARVEFRRWIISNGFVEYIHITSIFYDRLYSALLFMEYLMHRRSITHQLRREKNFHSKMSLTDKMEAMADEMDIRNGMLKYMDALNRMRNCMIHAAGTVTRRHCNYPDRLIVKWPRMNIKSGVDANSLVAVKSGDILQGGALVAIGFDETSKEFPLGSTIDIAVWEIYEIFMFAQLDIDELSRSIDGFNQSLADANGAETIIGDGNKKTWRYAATRGDIEGLVRVLNV